MDFYWLKKLFLKKRLYKIGAYHEAAHVVFAYLYGYTCGYTELDTENPGDGRTQFIFGQHRVAVNTILNQINVIFNNLTAGQQLNLVKHAHWLSMIFCAGACSEAYFFKSFWHKTYRPILKGPDLEALNSINQLLGSIHVNPIQETLGTALCLIENFPSLRSTIQKIAEETLSNPRKRLDQEQIQQILANENFNTTRDDIINNGAKLCR